MSSTMRRDIETTECRMAKNQVRYLIYIRGDYKSYPGEIKDLRWDLIGLIFGWKDFHFKSSYGKDLKLDLKLDLIVGQRDSF